MDGMLALVREKVQVSGSWLKDGQVLAHACFGEGGSGPCESLSSSDLV
jgi:hypothetical protein